jgi:hypothetical protein
MKVIPPSAPGENFPFLPPVTAQENASPVLTGLENFSARPSYATLAFALADGVGILADGKIIAMSGRGMISLAVQTGEISQTLAGFDDTGCGHGRHGSS